MIILSIIYEVEEIKQFEKPFEKIFKSKCAFGEIFSEQISEKLLLCPTDGYFLSEKQFDALLCTLKEICENEIIISITEYEEMFSLNSQHWRFDTKTEYSQYIKQDIYLENAIYSNKGDWGLLISHEDYAVLGGDKCFVDTFKKYYNAWIDDIANFKMAWEHNKKEYGSDLSWVSTLEKHLNINIL